MLWYRYYLLQLFPHWTVHPVGSVLTQSLPRTPLWLPLHNIVHLGPTRGTWSPTTAALGPWQPPPRLSSPAPLATAPIQTSRWARGPLRILASWAAHVIASPPMSLTCRSPRARSILRSATGTIHRRTAAEQDPTRSPRRIPYRRSPPPPPARQSTPSEYSRPGPSAP